MFRLSHYHSDNCDSPSFPTRRQAVHSLWYLCLSYAYLEKLKWKKNKGYFFSKGMQTIWRGWMTLLAAVSPSDAALLPRLFQMRSDGWNSLNPPSICSHWERCWTCCPPGVRPSLVLRRGRSDSPAPTNSGLGQAEPLGRAGFRLCTGEP